MSNFTFGYNVLKSRQLAPFPMDKVKIKKNNSVWYATSILKLIEIIIIYLCSNVSFVGMYYTTLPIHQGLLKTRTITEDNKYSLNSKYPLNSTLAYTIT